VADPVIGFVGAGRLGEPAAVRLLDAGAPVRLYARRPEVRDRLGRRRAVVVDTVREAARDADVLLVFVFSDEQVRELLIGDGGAIAAMRPGTVVLVHTTVAPRTLDALARAAAPGGIAVVDAPVSGNADDVRRGALTVLLGGEPDAVDRCEKIVAAYADPILRVGPAGAAMKTKLLNNVLFAAQLQLAAQVAGMAEGLGLDPMPTLQSLLRCSGASAAMEHMARSGDIAAFAASVGPYLRKDVRACEAASRELSLSLGLVGEVAREGPLDIA